MPELGRYALMLAVALAVYVALGGLWANRRADARFQESVRGATIGIAMATTVAVFTLEYLLVTGDYAVRAVYNHSDQALPLMYKLGALWGGDSGSVLFWGWILSLYAAFVAWRGWARESKMTPTVVPIMGGLLIFFTGVSNIVVNPFAPVAGHPTNGLGLDPLLQNLVMTIHPPAMYTGLIGMAVPAAYILSAIWQRVPSREWTPVVRRWMLFSWMFLSAAIVLGGMWAYMELGWGGYWEWDPVENASLLPWLTATAFLHSVQVEQRRGMYRWWTAFLGVGSFLLTLVGTYITRSGVLKNSVHSFAGTGVGPYFTVLFWGVLIAAVAVFALRRDYLKDRMALQDTMSKEGIYLMVNFFFSAITLVVLFGTFYPIISKWLMGTTVVLQIHFFNAMTAPMFLVLILLLGVAPVAAWRTTRLSTLAQRLWKPWVLALAVSAWAYHAGFTSGLQFLGVLLTTFSLGSMFQEFYRAARVQRKANHVSWLGGAWRAVVANRRRYGGYLAHIAFLIIVLGVVGSHTNNITVQQTLSQGQTTYLGGYSIRFNGLETVPKSTYTTTQANLTITQGKQVIHATSGDAFFAGSGQPVAMVYIKGGLMSDLYVVLDGWQPNGTKADFEIFVNPMISWIWIGMYILVAGTLVAMSAPAGRDAAPARSWEFVREERRPRLGTASQGDQLS